MRRLSLLISLVAAGCSAASPQLHTGGPPTRIDAISDGHGGYDVRISDSSRPATAEIGALPDVVWPALLEVYQAIGIPVTTIDANQKIAGNQKLEARRRLAGSLLSSFVDCGSNLTGNIADSYRVELFVVSKVSPAADGRSTLETKVNGSARSIEGASGNAVKCSSTGRLESRIAQQLRTRVAG